MASPKTVADLSLKPFLGSVWEQVAKRIFRARLHPQRHFVKGQLNPDLESDHFDAWVEVKGARCRFAFQLSPQQINGYRAMVEDNPFPYSTVLFAFFTHTVRGVLANYGERQPWVLARDLVLRVSHLTVLDLQVVLHILEREKLETRHFRGYSPVILWPQQINVGFLRNHAAAFSRFELDPEKFSAEKRRVVARFGKTIKRIPSVWILQKDSQNSSQED